MAYKKRFRGYASKGYGYGRKAYGGARRGYTKGRKSIGVSNEYLAGVAVGITNYDEKLPKDLVLGLAVAPSKLVGRGILGKAKAFSQGVIAGNMLQKLTGFNLGSGGGGGANFGI